MGSDDVLGEERLLELIEVGRSLVGDLELERVLDNLLDRAREITGARYAALGILDERCEQLERFLTRGIDELTHRAIGNLPRGRGVLGVLISDPRPLRLDDVAGHPRSYGFPLNHPPMSSFLGVPVMIRGQAWGNLYLTEKEGGSGFTAADETAVVILADWAAIAIENARLLRAASSSAATSSSERCAAWRRRRRSPRPSAGETRLDRVLELIVKRARALVDARALVILLAEGDELVVAAQAGELPPGVAGLRLRIQGSLARRRPAPAARRARQSWARALAGRPTRSGSVRTRRCSSRSPTARRASECSPRIDRLGGRDTAFEPTTSGCCARSRASAATAVATARARRRPTSCTAASRRPSASAGAGRASCTTRSCRRWPALRLRLAAASPQGEARGAAPVAGRGGRRSSTTRSASCGR